MSVTLGALVIAISTEFSVLLSERFRAEREAGHAPAAALERTYRSTGAAVLASGATAIAGFAVLVVSDIRMLRDFGLVTVVDLTVALAGVMLVLPAVLLLAERDEPLRVPALRRVRRRKPPARAARPGRVSGPPSRGGARAAPAGRRQPLRLVPRRRGRAGHRLRHAEHRAQPRPRLGGRAGRHAAAAVRRAARARRDRAATSTSRGAPARAPRARARRATCAAAGSLNVCELWERGPVVLAFLATRGARCTAELDALERVRGGHPGVQFAAVSIRGDRAELRAVVRRHRWGFPVAYDRDGILANLYGVAVCPQVTFALPGGRVTATTVGELDRAGLERRLGALERAARAAGWRPPAR